MMTAVPRQTVLPDGRTQWPPEVAREVFYHDCPPEEAAQAAKYSVPREGCPWASGPLSPPSPTENAPGRPAVDPGAVESGEHSRSLLLANEATTAPAREAAEVNQLASGGPFIACFVVAAIGEWQP